MEYLVKWEGTDEHGNAWKDTWEPAHMIPDSCRLEFDEEHYRLLADAHREPGKVHKVPDGGAHARERLLEPPKALSKTALLKDSARPWPMKAVYVLLSVLGNGLPSAPRAISISAEIADPHGLLQGGLSTGLHEYIKLKAGETFNAEAVSSIHGKSFDQLQSAAHHSAAEVFQHWLSWLQAALTRAGDGVPFVLVTWKGYSTGAFSLLSTELNRYGLTLPHSRLKVMDLADVIRAKKLFESVSLAECASAALHEAEEMPTRWAGARTRSAALALGDLSSAEAWRSPSAEPILLGLLVQVLAARTSGAGKVVGKAGCALPCTPFWAYGSELSAYEKQQQNDPEPPPWKRGPPPCEQALGLTFRPCGKLAEGGPSEALFAAVGLNGDDAAHLSPPGVDDQKGSPNEMVRSLILQVFHFYFPEPVLGEDHSKNVLQRIVDATNEKAMEFVVRERAKGPLRAATEDNPLDEFNLEPGPHSRHRAPAMVTDPLTVDELLTYLGIRILIGAYNVDVIDYCWSSTEHFRVPEIAESMKLDRFKLINSHLSFMMADDNSNLDGPNAKIRKIYDVTEWLRGACQRAWDPEPDVVPDESRLRLSSRYCSFATTLLCKPIKHGLTIYCLNFCRTRYLYNFEWFTGKQSDHGLGQPTDTAPLNEDNPEEMKYMLGLMDRLITNDFDDTGACVYTDKAFTSIKLARLLAKRRLAIVGMLRTLGRPKVRPRGNAEYWPFRHYSKAEMDLYIRGFRREAHTAVESGDIKWLNAQLWKDAKWVTLITTTFFSTVPERVQRWEKSERCRVPVECSTAVKRYNKFMGAVDQFNKELAKTHMAMGRCKQRFHRSLFLGWLLPAVGVVNVRTAFCELVKETWGAAALKKLQKAHGVATTTFPKWFQLRLGELLIEKGVVQATTANGGEEPHFKPTRSKFHWERRFVLPSPPGYTVNHPRREAVDLSKKPCKIPIGWDSKTGKAIRWLGGGADRKRPGDRCQLCSIRAMRAGLPIGKNSRFSRFACKHCRVILCDGCWDLWDHVNERAPPELPPAAAGKPRPDRTPSRPEPAAQPLLAPHCPKGHVMNGNTMDGSGLQCDGCDNALGVSFFSCSACDYDLCLHCSGDSPVTERAERANGRAEEPPSEAPGAPAIAKHRPKARRLPSKEAKKRGANAAAKREQKRQAREAKLKAAREKKRAENRKSAASLKRNAGDECERPRKRRRGGM
jgi:hypothetical protein